MTNHNLNPVERAEQAVAVLVAGCAEQVEALKNLAVLLERTTAACEALLKYVANHENHHCKGKEK